MHQHTSKIRGIITIMVAGGWRILSHPLYLCSCNGYRGYLYVCKMRKDVFRYARNCVMNGAGKLSLRRGVEQWRTMTQAPVCADAHLDSTIMVNVGCIPPIESSIYKRKKNKDKKLHKFTLHAHCWEECAVYQSSCRNVTESLKHTSFNSNE